MAARVAREERVARFETVRRARDGRDVPVALTASALRDEAGALVGRSCVLEDLSALQRLRSRVASQEQLLAHITHEAADAIVGVDADGRITSWNRGAERLLGLEAASVLGRPGGEIMGEAAAPGAAPAGGAAGAGARPPHGVARRPRRAAPHGRLGGAAGRARARAWPAWRWWRAISRRSCGSTGSWSARRSWRWWAAWRPAWPTRSARRSTSSAPPPST